MLYTTGTSIVMPSMTLILLDLFPAMRGLASSLQSFVNFSLAALAAGTVAPALAHSTRSLALGMTAFAALGFALWLVYQRRAREELGSWVP
jgi:DHA1 family bicyclomycin/chloramphenicol resistance-like MFS transporter